MKSIFLIEDENNIEYVYSKDSLEYIMDNCHNTGEVFTKADIVRCKDAFRDTEVIFATWEMPPFSAEEIRAYFPALKAIFYAAGTVQRFARPFLQNNVRVFSAWAANAVPVAEFTLAQILLANTGFFHQSQFMSRGKAVPVLPTVFGGNYEVTVGIIGAGMIGRRVIELLKPFRVSTVVYDPFLSEEAAAALGTEKVGLEELFCRCEVVSNHLADNAQTKGMLNYPLFSAMKSGATFINTGRGAQVVEEDLVRLLRERSDVFALLDVTQTEPLEAGHPFYELDNCILSPHIAGSKGNEVHRMAEYMIDECKRFIAGEPCLYEVTEAMLETMA